MWGSGIILDAYPPQAEGAMPPYDLAAIGSFVVSLCTLSCLVYLVLRLGHSGRRQQTVFVQNPGCRDLDLGFQADPIVAQAWLRGSHGENLSKLEFQQFMLLSRTLTNRIEELYLQHRAGLVGDPQFESRIAEMRDLFADPGLKAIWQVFRPSLERSFVEFFDRVVGEAAVAAPIDHFEEWRVALAAEQLAAV
jgi:hypothetical protein